MILYKIADKVVFNILKKNKRWLFRNYFNNWGTFKIWRSQ